MSKIKSFKPQQKTKTQKQNQTAPAKTNVPKWSNPEYKNTSSAEELEEMERQTLELLAKLEEKEVLKKENTNTENLKAEELAKHIRDRFAKEHADLEIRRLLETVHYANSYEDKVLKETAFLVDEISEYMFKLEIANRDFVVGYFNTLIIDPAIEATEYNFVLMEVESLIENSFLELPEEEE